ncbi:hypothetical protein OUZ56_007598 [Daphnia magna]|uniref:Uncharacterized protein n=1 Tax=Daphnia magna TaxID=35525 RepID=A0ABR0AAF1_9CRUS|nr:hypothetical protein OUZ56_007598 [Daphnia magna]
MKLGLVKMRSLSVPVIFWTTVFLFASSYMAIPLTNNLKHIRDILQRARPSRNIDEEVFSIVSIVDELVNLGKHPETLCPFQVEKKTVKKEHTLGQFTVKINEIVCSGACSHCGVGRSCKQLMTPLVVTFSNPATGMPHNVISTDVAIGCSCTPDDSGLLGEDILRR